MQDQYTGQAGTFYTDPDSGQRLSQQEWDELQAKKAEKPTNTKQAKAQE